MVDGIRPVEAEFAKNELEHLEVVVLFVADHVDNLIEVVFVVALFGRAQILCHIDRGAVAAQQQLLIEAVGRQVAPDGAVGAPIEHTFRQTFIHERLAVLVGLGFVVDAIERDAEPAVGLVEAGINPAVHLLPERPHFWVALFPLDQHGLRLLKDRRILLRFFLRHAARHQFRHLSLEQVVELHIVVPHQVVAFLTGGLRRLAVSAAQPGQHRLADVDAAVVDQIHFQHLVSASSQQLADRPAQQVVSDVAQVKRLVGIRAGKLHHHGSAGSRQLPEIGLRGDFRQVGSPIRTGKLDVEEPFDHAETSHLRFILLQPGSNLVRRGLGGLSARPKQRENYEGNITLEFFAGGLHLDQTGRGFNAI